MESRTLSRANGSCTNRRGWSKSLDTVITHDAKKNPSPPSTNWQDFLFDRRLFVNFLPLDDWIPVTPRSIIDHDQRLRPMEIPCRAISSPREERGPSLSLSLSARRREEEEEEEVRAACACGWAITPFPSPSAPTRSDNIIIGFNLR